MNQELLRSIFLVLINICSLSGFILTRKLGSTPMFKWRPSSATVIDENDILQLKWSSRPVFKAEDVCSSLPPLSSTDKIRLTSGERMQWQSRMGREGFGWVCCEVKASADVVFNELTMFSRYNEMIPTVRDVKILSVSERTRSTAAEFSLSKFRLRVNVVKTIDNEKKMIRFTLDKLRPNIALRKADGFWLVQPDHERTDYCRVWLYANVVASSLLPTVIVDYAASKALPRATSWLQTYFSARQSELKNDVCNKIL